MTISTAPSADAPKQQAAEHSPITDQQIDALARLLLDLAERNGAPDESPTNTEEGDQ